MLAGHYDTVPAQENVPGLIEDGAVHGCGASDMKGGVAVALELVRELAEHDPGPVDVALLLFGREELPPATTRSPRCSTAAPPVHEADLAVLLEPTDLEIQAGASGNLTVRVTFHGRSGHSARPWLADNALHRAIEGLARVAGHERREAVVDGLPFFEVVSVTRLAGGVADNVVPGAAVATLNLRYPPDRTPDEAEDVLLCARPDGRDGRDRRELAAGSGLGGRAARPGAARRLATSRSGRSRRGRTWRTSRPVGFLPSTSGPGPRASRTPTTSASRSPRSSGPTRLFAGSCSE